MLSNKQIRLKSFTLADQKKITFPNDEIAEAAIPKKF
jgi:hypothetical protein